MYTNTTGGMYPTELKAQTVKKYSKDVQNPVTLILSHENLLNCKPSLICNNFFFITINMLICGDFFSSTDALVNTSSWLSILYTSTCFYLLLYNSPYKVPPFNTFSPL